MDWRSRAGARPAAGLRQSESGAAGDAVGTSRSRRAAASAWPAAGSPDGLGTGEVAGTGSRSTAQVRRSPGARPTRGAAPRGMQVERLRASQSTVLVDAAGRDGSGRMPMALGEGAPGRVKIYIGLQAEGKLAGRGEVPDSREAPWLVQQQEAPIWQNRLAAVTTPRGVRLPPRRTNSAGDRQLPCLKTTRRIRPEGQWDKGWASAEPLVASKPVDREAAQVWTQGAQPECRSSAPARSVPVGRRIGGDVLRNKTCCPALYVET
jgi:hypothetical protein